VKVLLVRHGQSLNNILASDLPYEEYINTRSHEPPLTPVGEEQARLVAEFLGEQNGQVSTAPPGTRQAALVQGTIAALYTSPMLRALQTTAPIAAALGLTPQVWVDIHEHGGLFTGDPQAGSATYFAGLNRDDMAAQFPGYRLPPEVTDEGWWWGDYEEMHECAERARRVGEALSVMAEERGDEVMLLVSHGTFLDQLFKALLGVSNAADTDMRFHFSHLNTGISRLDFLEGGHVAIRYVNRVPHLEPRLHTR
jgi:broad specificity phosphatase PhoE